AVGTFNLLEVIRKENPEALMLFSSSMRVYGQMQNEPVVKSGRAYQLKNYPKGIPENYPLNLHTPYSCSKGAADQYVRDYSRVFGLRTVVFRQSCIYGPGQFAIENHGWVNWFIASALAGREIRIFGDGRQVRDILFIDDLVDAYRKAVSSASVINGEILNVGGGPERALSLRELLQMLDSSFGIKTRVEYTSWRKGDTKAYISDVSKAKRLMKWQPKTTIIHGVDATLKWMNGIRIK
ncbi:MAG: NAD-dependent epimerase/dehydratase family protein, partial [Fibrobacteres bacterium]|nr:NAD-dependent epimerase/dehydratase family protein [Fibrobacterota bacterium]